MSNECFRISKRAKECTINVSDTYSEKVKIYSLNTGKESQHFYLPIGSSCAFALYLSNVAEQPLDAEDHLHMFLEAFLDVYEEEIKKRDLGNKGWSAESVVHDAHNHFYILGSAPELCHDEYIGITLGLELSMCKYIFTNYKEKEKSND